MTKPISNERVTWLREREIVLNECIRIAQTEMHSMQSGRGVRDDLQNALRNFSAERTANAIEREALLKYGVSE